MNPNPDARLMWRHVMTPHYKRVERISRRLGLTDSLAHIWAYSLHVCYGFDLPFEYWHTKVAGRPVQIRDFIGEFHLDLHVREILLHAGKSSQASLSLKNWNDFAEFHNAINRQSDKTSGTSSDIWLTLHRMGHQQISHFDRVDFNYLGRYWSLFRRKPIAELLERSFGMTVLEYFLLVAGVFTVYLDRPESDLIHDLSALDIPTDAMRERLATVSTTPQNVRRRLSEARRFDSSWAYTFNEIKRTPLLQLRPTAPNRLFCPRPPLLVRRLLSSVFFDLVSKQGFAEAFGDGVEDLVGDLIRRSDRRLSPNKPAPYRTGSGLRHGADWIISDASGHVFVECKSARIPIQAQVAPTAEDVSAGMNRLADAVVQNYANIHDAVNGRTEWRTNGLPTYSLIVTLEDWNLFSPIASDALRSLVEQKLIGRHLQPSLMSTTPYVVVSVRDLPDLTHAMAEQGIARLLDEKCGQKYEQYLVSSFLEETEYKSDAANRLFKADSGELFQEFNARFGRPAVIHDRWG
jgi:hypothetical protein